MVSLRCVWVNLEWTKTMTCLGYPSCSACLRANLHLQWQTMITLTGRLKDERHTLSKIAHITGLVDTTTSFSGTVVTSKVAPSSEYTLACMVPTNSRCRCNISSREVSCKVPDDISLESSLKTWTMELACDVRQRQSNRPGP